MTFQKCWSIHNLLLKCIIIICILDGEELTVVKEDELNPLKKLKFKVSKTGRTTGLTTGYIHDEKLSTRNWKDCYCISSGNSVDFSKRGDSGSGVFLDEKGGTQKPLGILIGGLIKKRIKFVCKIDNVLSKHNLKIVKVAKKSKQAKKWTCLLNCNIAVICMIIFITYVTLYILFDKERSSPALSDGKHFEL